MSQQKDVFESQCTIYINTKEDEDNPNGITCYSESDKEKKSTSCPCDVSLDKQVYKYHEWIINILVIAQEQYEFPQEENSKKILPFLFGDSEEDYSKRIQHMIDITILTVQLIVEFAKRVPGFETISRKDQITLIKEGSNEVIMLRAARKYDIKTDSLIFADNQPYTKERYHSLENSVDNIFHFLETIGILKVDDAEYALLTAIVIFSERPGLLEPKKVEKIQEVYIKILKSYIASNGPCDKNRVANLLSTLVELPNLSFLNSQWCSILKREKLPPS